MYTNPELYCLTEQELLKVFPKTYYEKYANHLKILEFQKLIVDQQQKKTRIKFQPRNDKLQNRIKSAIPKQQAKRIRMSNYDNFQDTIDKNKLQLKRMMKYSSVLNLKMKISPEKRNVIRSPNKNQTIISQSTLLNMKAIQDLEFQRKQRLKDEMRINLQKKSICKFVKKCRSAQTTSRKRPSVSQPQSNQNKAITQRKLAIKLQEVAMDSLYKNQIINQSSQKLHEKNASYISNVNSAIRKSYNLLRKAGMTQLQQQNTLKLFKKRNSSKTALGQRNQNRKNLIVETKRIKQQVMLMPTLKRSDANFQKIELLSDQLNLDQ